MRITVSHYLLVVVFNQTAFDGMLQAVVSVPGECRREYHRRDGNDSGTSLRLVVAITNYGRGDNPGQEILEI
jgi:hypothetical protein